MKKILFIFLVCPLILPVFADTQPEEGIEVKVQVEGERVIVDLDFVVPATRQQAWAVLTDFEHLADFISNLKENKVVSATEDTVNIFQRGSAKYGPVSFSFEATREIRLSPFDEIRSRLVSGTMRKMDATTRLIDEGAQTRIIYHADSIPGVWIPPVIGKIFIEHETREQFRELRNEITRRKNATSQGRQIAAISLLAG